MKRLKRNGPKAIDALHGLARFGVRRIKFVAGRFLKFFKVVRAQGFADAVVFAEPFAEVDQLAAV